MKGSIAALDVGARRIGVARCDPTRTVVTPVTVLERASPERDKRRLAEIIDREEPVMLVVGLPLLMSGEEGESPWAELPFRVPPSDHGDPTRKVPTPTARPLEPEPSPRRRHFRRGQFPSGTLCSP